MTTQPSTTADNIALVRSAFDALNEGDIDTHPHRRSTEPAVTAMRSLPR
jgi:hypothetical protein